VHAQGPDTMYEKYFLLLKKFISKPVESLLKMDKSITFNNVQ